MDHGFGAQPLIGQDNTPCDWSDNCQTFNVSRSCDELQNLHVLWHEDRYLYYGIVGYDRLCHSHKSQI
ncbi:hypothetical protein J1614_003752 [Plenodomus biglobosus]|nr:hypothetical protein J1614_003752 [Plenodomus biglobosus]